MVGDGWRGGIRTPMGPVNNRGHYRLCYPPMGVWSVGVVVSSGVKAEGRGRAVRGWSPLRAPSGGRRIEWGVAPSAEFFVGVAGEK